MTITILSQGLTADTENSVGAALIKCISSDDYNSFTFISAFVSEAGITGLAHHINQAREKYVSLNVVVGVDQRATSKEALEVLLSLNINAHIFNQPGQNIFHPKIYLFEGPRSSAVIVGSSNMTVGGLFANVEASVHIELIHEDPADLKIITDLKARFEGLFDFTDANLQPITEELIGRLVAAKIVPTAAEQREIRKIAQVVLAEDAEANAAGKPIFPKRVSSPSVPKEFRGGTRRVAVLGEGLEEEVLEVPVLDPAPMPTFELVWRRRRLPESSVEIAAAGTNPTGGLRLVQDKFEVEGVVIRQGTYFRNSVFSDLQWATEKEVPFVEKAIGKFYVSVLGEDLGEFNMEIRHKPSGEAGQHNYTTSISWGGLSRPIRERGLANRTLNLYRSVETNGTFKIEIV